VGERDGDDAVRVGGLGEVLLGHSAPAALKNAIDFPYAQWQNKAAGFVSYGVDGSWRWQRRCAGAPVSAHPSSMSSAAEPRWTRWHAGTRWLRRSRAGRRRPGRQTWWRTPGWWRCSLTRARCCVLARTTTATPQRWASLAPDPEGEPFFFLKPPATSVIGTGEPIPCPPTALLDWEAELGVVIGHRAKDVMAENAFDFIAGFLVANDVSARDRTATADAVSPHFVYDWLGHKGQDGFCPLGPGIVPARQVEDPQKLQLRLSVNEVVRQDCSTADM
jgi:Fumarylacetoacetate (FAA) hydrolase family